MTTICRNCRRVKPHKGDRLCGACWQRWDSAGRPDVIPEPMPKADQLALARSRKGATYRGRLEDYLELTTEFGVKDDEVAAERMGVDVRTIRRWKARLRAEAAA